MKKFGKWLMGLSMLQLLGLMLAVLLLTLVGAGLIKSLTSPPAPTRVSLDQIEQALSDKDVTKATIDDGTGTITLKLDDSVQNADLKAAIDKLAAEQDGADTRQIASNYPRAYAETLTTSVLAANVELETEPIPTTEPLWRVLVPLIPAFLIVGFLVWMLKSGALSGGVSKMGKRGEALGEKPSVRFADVAGNPEAVAQMRESVEVLRHPEDFIAMNAEAPRAILMYGPAGTGKTLLAKAVAGEAEVPFFAVEGSAFVETFVGVGARRVRDIFDKARKAAAEEGNSGAIIFIDEIDAMARARGATLHPGESESESTLNQLLAEVEGFRDTNVLLIATTNRADVLDPAMLSRFDEQISVGLPDRKGREEILGVHTRTKPLDEGARAELSTIAKLTPGMSGRDLSNLIDRASRTAVSRFKAAREAAGDDEQSLAKEAKATVKKMTKAHKKDADLGEQLSMMVSQGRAITREDLHSALSAATLGRAATSKVITEHDRKVTSVHEAGHTVAAMLSPTLPTPSVVTIIPHGGAGGVTKIPGDDDIFLGHQRALDQLVMAMAGRAAEMIEFGEESFTSGASGDLSAATKLATAMITEVGMSKLGLAAIDADSLRMGGEMAMRVHDEVNTFLADALNRAKALLTSTEGSALLAKVSAALHEEETLYADDLLRIEASVKEELSSPRLIKS